MSWWAEFSARFDRTRPPLLHIATDTGEGPVVILVHGIASSSVTFFEVIPLLAPTHRVIAVDILGFGESPAPVDCEYTLEDHVDALAATIKSLKLKEPFTLVGHSLGSLIVSRFAASYRPLPTQRNTVRRVVLVGPPVYLAPSEIGNPKVRARVSAYLKAFDFLRANKEFTMANAAIVSRLLPKGIFELTEKTWDPFIKSLKNCIESQTLVSDVASLQVPVDVIYGTLDAFIPPGAMSVIERMRHVTMYRVEANDHIIRKRLARVVARAVNSDAVTGSADRSGSAPLMPNPA